MPTARLLWSWRCGTDIEIDVTGTGMVDKPGISRFDLAVGHK